VIALKVIGGAFGVAFIGYAASQGFPYAVIMAVLEAVAIWIMLLLLRVERVRPAESVPAPVYSAHPIPTVHGGSSAEAIGGPRRAISAPALHLHFHGVGEDQVAEVVRQLR
jgi:hypothetical protein